WHFLIDDFTSTTPGDYAGRIQSQIATKPALAARTQKFHADHYEVAAYMNGVDIVVAPSCLPEQYGRVLAEAMACGKVVVASEAGAYPELIQDCGLIVPQADAQALAKTLRQVLLDPSLAGDLGTKAAKRASETLSTDVQARIIEQHLNETISSVTTRSPAHSLP